MWYHPPSISSLIGHAIDHCLHHFETQWSSTICCLLRRDPYPDPWKSAEPCLPLYLYGPKYRDIDTYTVDTPGNVYYVDIGKDSFHLSDGTPAELTYVLIAPAAVAASLAHKSIHR